MSRSAGTYPHKRMPLWRKWALVLGLVFGLPLGLVFALGIYPYFSLPTPDEYFYIGKKRVLGYRPVRSPDGKKVTFRARSRAYIAGGSTHIYVANADGSNQIMLTRDGGNYSWSPDSKRIAFVVSPLESKELHIVDADGKNRIEFPLKMDENTIPSNILWSSDEKEIAVKLRGGSLDGTHSVLSMLTAEIRTELMRRPFPPLQVGMETSYDSLIIEAAQRYGVPPELIKAMIQVESGFNPQAISPKGARGLMQLMPATEKRYGVSNVFDPAQNIEAGTHYLSDLLKRYGQNPELALAAYNWGEARIDALGGAPGVSFTSIASRLPEETRIYVPMVIALWEAYKRGGI